MFDEYTTDWGTYCDAWKLNPHGPARRGCGMQASHDIGGVIYLCRFHYKNAYNDLWFKVMTQESNLPFTLQDDEYDTQLGTLRKAMNRQHREIEDLESKNSALESKVQKYRERKLTITYKPKSAPTRGQQVYFIRCEDQVKIGVSQNPEQRLRDLQRSGNGTFAPPKIDLTTAEIVAIEPGGLKRERELHEKFANLRTVGEWFLEEDELTEYIEGLLVKVSA